MTRISQQAGRYFETLTTRFGDGWNRFWFAPRDPATLGMLRILTGCVALYFLATFSPDLVRFFGPQGLLPVETVRNLAGPDSFRPSVLQYVSAPSELWAVHVAGLVIVGLFTAGVFTRVTSVLALVVILSYIHRATMLTGPCEPILAMTIFYLCLGPAGARYSVDAWRRRRRAAQHGGVEETLEIAPSTSATIATRLLQLHVSLVYVMMGIAKLADPTDVWWLGEAMWWLAARPDSRLVDVTWLLADHPYVLNGWTHAQVIFELAFGLLIWNRLARPLLVVVAAGMWLLLALVSGLPLFCLMMFIASLAFVSPAVVLTLTEAPAVRPGEVPAEAI